MANSNNSYEINALNDLAGLYKSSLSSALTSDRYTEIKAISDKYQLTDEASGDFNNAYLLLRNSVLKDSKYIDENENDYSTELGKLLIKYYEDFLTNSDISKLISITENYNNVIEAAYDLRKLSENTSNDITEVKKVYSNIISEIFGLYLIPGTSVELYDGAFVTPSDFAIRNGSYAMTIYNKVVNGETIDECKKSGILAGLYFFFIQMLNSVASEFGISMDLQIDIPTNYTTLEIGQTQYSVFAVEMPDESTTVTTLSNTSGTIVPVLLYGGKPVIKKKYKLAKIIVNPLWIDSTSSARYIYITYNTFSDEIVENTSTSFNNVHSNDGALTKITYKNDESYYFDSDGTGYLLNARILFYNYYENGTTAIAAYDGMPASDVSASLYASVSTDPTYGKVNSVDAPDTFITTIASVGGENNFNFSNIYENEIDSLKLQYMAIDSTDPGGETNDTRLSYEKRSANSIEAYYTENKTNLLFFELKDICVTEDNYRQIDETTDENGKTSDVVYEFLKKYSPDSIAGESVNNPYENSTTYIKYSFSIRIFYKEFNKVLRQATYANYNDKLIAYMLSTNIETDSFKKMANVYTAYNTLINSDGSSIIAASDITSDNMMILKAIRSNSVICRRSADNDIIAYLQGSVGNGVVIFGTDSDSQTDIDNLLRIYSETRNYFYKVLFNNAFIYEDGYPLFIKLYIMAYSIERFMSSRLDSTKTISEFTKSDCNKFLTSYGLGTFVKQIDSKNFISSLAYKKKIISKYNDLLANKGSKTVVDVLLNLFSSSNSDISLFKYVIYNSVENESEPVHTKVLDMPYETKNTAYYLNNSKTAVDYDSFISDDQYWTTEDVPESYLQSNLKSAQAIKYLGIKSETNLYTKYVQTKYALSAIDYVNDTFLNNDNTTKLLSTVTVTSTLFQKPIRIADLYAACRLMYSVYIRESELYYCGNLADNHVTTKHNGNRYYGINKNFNLNDNGSGYSSELIDLFKSPLIYSSESTTALNVTTLNIPLLYTWETGPLIADSLTVKDADIYESAISSPSIGALFPLKAYAGRFEKSSIQDKYFDLFSETAYSEGIIKDNEAGSYFNLGNIELGVNSIMPDILSSVTLVNAFNILRSETDILDNAAVSNYDLRNAVFQYATYAGSDKYPTSQTAFADAGLSSYYSSLITRMLDFPTRYLAGEYSNKYGCYCQKDFSELLDKLFNDFFTTENDTLVHFSNNGHLSNDDGYTKLTKNDIALITQYSGILTSSDSDSAAGSSVADYIFSGILTGYDKDDFITSLEGSDTAWTDIRNNETLFTEYTDKLIELLNAVIDYCEIYDKLEPDFGMSTSIDNYFDFVKTAIKFFISYTSTLRDSDVILKYDNTGETLPITYTFTDEITSDLTETFYYDESVSIEENS